ncbi:hypothetical protein VPH35_078585 [Triticum aestivum]
MHFLLLLQIQIQRSRKPVWWSTALRTQQRSRPLSVRPAPSSTDDDRACRRATTTCGGTISSPRRTPLPPWRRTSRSHRPPAPAIPASTASVSRHRDPASEARPGLHVVPALDEEQRQPEALRHGVRRATPRAGTGAGASRGHHRLGHRRGRPPVHVPAAAAGSWCRCKKFKCHSSGRTDLTHGAPSHKVVVARRGIKLASAAPFGWHATPFFLETSF